MRIGEYELAILRYLSYDRHEPEYGPLRKTIGLDPHDLLNSFKTYIYEPGISKELSYYRKKDMKKVLHKYQVTFSRALKRLIKKKLIYRSWTVYVKSGIDSIKLYVEDGGKVEYGKYKDCNFVVFHSRYQDVPDFEICDIVCDYFLTDKGYSELAKRIPESMYSNALKYHVRKNKSLEVKT